MKIVLISAALVVAMTTPAFAKHCPKDVAIKTLHEAKSILGLKPFKAMSFAGCPPIEFQSIPGVASPPAAA